MMPYRSWSLYGAGRTANVSATTCSATRSKTEPSSGRNRYGSGAGGLSARSFLRPRLVVGGQRRLRQALRRELPSSAMRQWVVHLDQPELFELLPALVHLVADPVQIAADTSWECHPDGFAWCLCRQPRSNSSCHLHDRE